MINNTNALEIFLKFFKNSNKISFVHTRLIQIIVKHHPDVTFIAKIYELIRHRLENKNDIHNLIYPNNLYGRIGGSPTDTTISEVFANRFLPSAVEKHGVVNLNSLVKVFDLKLALKPDELKSIIESYVKYRNPISKAACYHLCTIFEKKINRILVSEFNSDGNYMHNLNAQASICYFNSENYYGNYGSQMIRLLAIPNTIDSRSSSAFPRRPISYDGNVSSGSSPGSSPSYQSNFREFLDSRTQPELQQGILIEKHTLIEKSPFFQAMLRNNSFRESSLEVIDIVQCTDLSLNFVIHVLKGCRNCDTIKSPDISKSNAGEILELANRFLLSEDILAFIESTLFETFRNSEIKDLSSAWDSFRRLQNFPISYWKKISMLEAIRQTMNKNNWKEVVLFEENLELSGLVKEFCELLVL